MESIDSERVKNESIGMSHGEKHLPVGVIVSNWSLSLSNMKDFVLVV